MEISQDILYLKKVSHKTLYIVIPVMLLKKVLNTYARVNMARTGPFAEVITVSSNSGKGLRELVMVTEKFLVIFLYDWDLL